MIQSKLNQISNLIQIIYWVNDNYNKLLKANKIIIIIIIFIINGNYLLKNNIRK